MRKLNITPGTKKAKLLTWMAEQKGVRYGEIQRYICDMNGLNYDQMVDEMVWKEIEMPDGGFRWGPAGTKKVRKHKGIWATNLSGGPDPILKNYCFKAGGKWFVTPEVSFKLHVQTRNAVKSSLEQEFKSDEIPNNSKVVERKIIRMMVDGKDVGWKPSDNGYVAGEIHTTKTQNPDQPRIDEAANLAAQIFAVNRALEEASEMIEKLTARQNELSKESFNLKNKLMTLLKGKVK